MPRAALPATPRPGLLSILRGRLPGIVFVLIAAAIGWNLKNEGSTQGGTPPLPGAIEARGFRPSFVDPASNAPVRFNPCEPIHYVINPTLAPPTAIEDIQTAFAVTAETAGLEFVYDGTTSEIPAPDRSSYQPDRYGQRWAPIVVGWTSGAPFSITSEVEGASAIAAGGSVYEFNEDGQPVYVTGLAAFDANADLRPGFGGRTWG